MSSAISISNVPLNALRAFEASARLGSFKAAAAELFVTPAAISHQILALEDYLGTPLFQRLNRAVRLTETGEGLAREVSAAFARIETALSAAAPAHARARNALVISAVPSFASRWLAPRLDRFQTLHPDIELRLLSSETIVDLAADGDVDIALRYGRGPYRGLHAEQLWPADLLVPVCSPALRASLPAELTLVDERTPVTLLRVSLPASEGVNARGRPDNVWTNWLKATGHTSPVLLAEAESGPLYSVSHLAVDAAIAGRGVALAPLALVADDLAAGRLVRMGTVAAPDINSYWLLCRKDKADLPRIQAFVDWITAEIAACQAPN
jgi:LysR family glycine cleavage system transcriptional activator